MNCPSKSTLQKAPFKLLLPLLSVYFLHEMKVECMYRVLLPKMASMIDFYCFFREKRVWKIVAALSLSMEFSSQRKKPYTRLQSNHVWEIWFRAFLLKSTRLNKTWMTLKLKKILVSLLEGVLWKKWWGLWQSFLNCLQLMIFTIFLGRRVCCTQAM